jgi:hypothetical protein
VTLEVASIALEVWLEDRSPASQATSDASAARARNRHCVRLPAAVPATTRETFAADDR